MRRLLVAIAALTAVGAMIALVLHAERLPEGPVPIVWDREACAHCRMHVGDPRFAAQLQTKDGRVLAFDDPGCLLAHLELEKPDVHAAYVRHVNEDRWVPLGSAGFVEVAESPMGHGLGAVDAAAAAITVEAARDRIAAAREARR